MEITRKVPRRSRLVIVLIHLNVYSFELMKFIQEIDTEESISRMKIVFKKLLSIFFLRLIDNNVVNMSAAIELKKYIY